MNTQWGEIPVHDAHVHFFSHSFFSALAAQKGQGESVLDIGHTLGWQMPPPDHERLAETWAHELDRHHVAKVSLIASVPGDEDSVAAAIAHLPGRFHGYFMVNPLAPDATARVETGLSQKGLRGICLFPAMQGYSIHDDRVRPILDLAAAQPGCLVFVHCGVLFVGVRRKLGLPSPFDMRFSNPIDLHAIALRYPKLHFVIPHFGAGYFREALMLCDLCPNVYLDTSSTNAWTRYEPSHADLKTVFRHALEVAGPRRLLFGTDSSFFPRGWHSAIFEIQSRALYEMGVSADDARLIFGGNLERLLG